MTGLMLNLKNRKKTTRTRPSKLVIPALERRTIGPLCDLSAACERLRCSDKELTRLIRCGEMPSVIFERQLKIRSIVIDNYLFNPGYSKDESRAQILRNNKPTEKRELCA